MASIIRICYYCRQSYKPRWTKSNKQFCSKQCQLSYNLNITTIVCKQCNNYFKRENSKQMFCSQSCAGTHTNYHKPRRILTPEQQELRKEIKREIARKSYHKRVKRMGGRHCVRCNGVITQLRKKYCDTCELNELPIYRVACRFNLNPKDQPSLFNSVLIKQYGWYRPKNWSYFNTTGVSWDHLYRISDGFKNKVPPDIMRHPANAELVPHKENQKRKTKSQITLDELIERIHQWDNGYIDLPYFYKMEAVP